MTKRGRARVEKSAGGVVVRLVDGVPHVLVIRDPYQNWGLPKGHLEKDEGAGDAALREVGEETGLADLVLGPELASIDWYFRSGDRLVHKFCAFFLMRSAVGDPEPELEEGITECVWIPIDEAEARVTYDNAREVVRVAKAALLADASG
jgi:8-oxo-dGTP pyrophosphatase MutT (NUDIX family)